MPLPFLPKSLAVLTRPWPKWCCQIRLTMTRAVKGLSRLAIHSASSLRRLSPSPSRLAGLEWAGDRAQEPRLDLLAPELEIAALEDIGGHRVSQAGVGGEIGHRLVVVGAAGIGEAGGLPCNQSQPILFLPGVEVPLGPGHALEIGDHPILEILGTHQGVVGRLPLLEPRLEVVGGFLAFGKHPVPSFSLSFPPVGLLERGFVLGELQGLGAESQRSEEGLQPVVVPGGNGVVLVVVAAGASQRDPQEGLTGGIHHVDQDVPPALGGTAFHPHSQRQEGGPDFPLVSKGPEGIARYLLLDEAVVGAILVEGPDDVVAVAPHVGARIFQPAAAGVGIAHQVQPVPSPALAVARVGQQPLDSPGVGLGRSILEEAVHVLGSRRQPDQSEVEPPQQRPAGSAGRRSQSFLLQSGQDEGVDGVGHPILPFDLGNSRLLQLGPGPDGLVLLLFPGFFSDRHPIDPAGNEIDFLRGQGIAAQRHGRLPLPPQAKHQRAGRAVSGKDGRSVESAALQQRIDRFHDQAAAVRLGTVATAAVALQNGPDFLLEAGSAIGRVGGAQSGSVQSQAEQAQADPGQDRP